jgi:hypothetical protein
MAQNPPGLGRFVEQLVIGGKEKRKKAQEVLTKRM